MCDRPAPGAAGRQLASRQAKVCASGEARSTPRYSGGQGTVPGGQRRQSGTAPTGTAVRNPPCTGYSCTPANAYPHSPEAPAPHNPIPFTQVAASRAGRSPLRTDTPRCPQAWSGGTTLPCTPRRRSSCRAAPWPGPYTDNADSATRPLGCWTPARPLHGRRGPSGPSRRWTPRRRVPGHRRPTLRPFQTVDAHSGPTPTRAAHPEGYSGGQQRNSRFCRNLRIRTDPTPS